MTDFVKKLQILNASCIILSTASLNDYQIIYNSSLFLVYPCFWIFLSVAGRTQHTLSYRLFKVWSLWQQRHNRTRYGGQRRFADTVFLRHVRGRTVSRMKLKVPRSTKLSLLFWLKIGIELILLFVGAIVCTVATISDEGAAIFAVAAWSLLKVMPARVYFR